MKSLKLSLTIIFIFVTSQSYGNVKETKDCFENINRAVFSFNESLDRAIFKPVAKGYSYLPQPIKASIRNVTSNISYTVTIPNHLLQGNFKNFAHDGGRFIINSIFGILGIFDPASALGLNKLEPEDYGQTLGFWGIGNGCYVMLPIFGPSTLRDTVGKVGNMLLDPFYMITVGEKEFLDNNFGDKTYYLEKGFDAVDFRYENLNNFENLQKNSLDYYSTVKSLYLQKRENQIQNSSGSNLEWKNFN